MYMWNTILKPDWFKKINPLMTRRFSSTQPIYHVLRLLQPNHQESHVNHHSYLPGTSHARVELNYFQIKSLSQKKKTSALSLNLLKRLIFISFPSSLYPFSVTHLLTITQLTRKNSFLGTFYPIKPQNLYDISFSVFILALGQNRIFLSCFQRGTAVEKNPTESELAWKFANNDFYRCLFSRGVFSSVRRCYGNLTLFTADDKWKMKIEMFQR